MADGTLKFGDLLIKLNLISQADLDDALHVAPQFALPVGRTLVLSGRLSEQELQVAVELQTLVNLKKFPIESASKIVDLVKSGIPPAVALKTVRVEENVEKSTLGQLLLDAGLADQHHLDEAQKVSYQTGMRLGRILSLTRIITAEQLEKALEVQSLLRQHRMSRQQAIDALKAQAPKKPAVEEAKPAASINARRSVRFTEFLVSSGLATETEMLNALETSLNKKLSLGETIVDLGLVSKRVCDKALELHSKVAHGQMALNDATAQLHKLAFGDPEHGAKSQSPLLGELLKMTGTVTDADINEAIALANKYPSVIGKMLVLSGAIDEATLIASLRCQFMLKHGYLKLEDGLSALKYCQRNQMSFDDALEELGLRTPHARSPATEPA